MLVQWKHDKSISIPLIRAPKQLWTQNKYKYDIMYLLLSNKAKPVKDNKIFKSFSVCLFVIQYGGVSFKIKNIFVSFHFILYKQPYY